MQAMLLLVGVAHATPGPITGYVTAADGRRIHAWERNVSWQAVDDDAQAKKEENYVDVDPSARHQTIRGFGASILESGAININALPEARQSKLLDLVFGPDGAWLSAIKAPIPCDDFCAAGPWYTYDDSPGDVNLVNFSIARDLRPNGTLHLVKRAKEMHGFDRDGDALVQSYMDYPPDWMLTGTFPHNVTVPHKYFPVLAEYFARFVEAYAEHNVTIDYMSMFNEPIDSYTHISNDDMAILLGEHVGPLFERRDLPTRLTYGGQCWRQTALDHIPYVWDALEGLGRVGSGNATRFMQHLAFHGYDCQFNCTRDRQHYDAVRRLSDAYPVEILMTEICYAYNGDDPNCARPETLWNCTSWPRNHSLAPALPRLDFSDGRIWGSRIISDLAAGVSGWIYWNLVLDMSGGPFQHSPKHNDGDANLQQAVIHVDPAAGEYHTTGLFWYLAHFSRFVRPGAVRLGTELRGPAEPDMALPEGTDGVEAMAFVTKDGSSVIVQLLNHNQKEEQVQIRLSGSRCMGPSGQRTACHSEPIVLPAESISSLRFSL